MRHLNIKIYGRVQGINFRKLTKHKAVELGIFGFVQNQPDGTVLVVAEGEDKALDEFVKWCKAGPPLSVIERVEVDEAETIGYNIFEVKY